MIEIYPRLYLGDQSTCTKGHEDLAVVHACKSPCHQAAAEYQGSLPPDHLYYLAVEHEYDQFLNLIDPPIPLFQVASFLYFRDFAARAYMLNGQRLLIHCNQGTSRAPSLALLFLAKDLHVLPDTSYAEAHEAFLPLTEVLAGYAPGRGIEQFMTEHWAEL